MYVNPAETGLYYLQSRYYAPEICRFINADNFVSTDIGSILSANMFAYCGNNPVKFIDPFGKKYINKHLGRIIVKEENEENSQTEDNTSTVVFGINVAVGFGIAFNISIGIGVDDIGNIGIIGSYSVGGGLPTASLSGFISKSNASSIRALEGNSYIVGLSGGEGAILGAELFSMYDAGKNNMVRGESIQFGVGCGIPIEFHAEISYSSVICFNLLDFVDEVILLFP